VSFFGIIKVFFRCRRFGNHFLFAVIFLETFFCRGDRCFFPVWFSLLPWFFWKRFFPPFYFLFPLQFFSLLCSYYFRSSNTFCNRTPYQARQ
jgi:hypothetical protein